MYPVPNPTEDDRDAEAPGRCMLLCVDLVGPTLVCANVYGWAGGIKGSKEAARTDDIITIVRMQFDKMPKGPELICGDLNGNLEAAPSSIELIKEEGWTDIGNDEALCGGRPGQHTCQANADVKESRIDYIITNAYPTPAVKAFRIDDDSDYPTNRPAFNDVCTKKLQTTTRQLHKPTNFADLFEAKLQEEEKRQQDIMNEQSKADGCEPTTADQNKIRKQHLESLHGHMDEQIRKRHYRLLQAHVAGDTTIQWDLIAAAMQETNIDYHELKGREATKMRWSSKAVFQNNEKTALRELTSMKTKPRGALQPKPNGIGKPRGSTIG